MKKPNSRSNRLRRLSRKRARNRAAVKAHHARNRLLKLYIAPELHARLTIVFPARGALPKLVRRLLTDTITAYEAEMAAKPNQGQAPA